jgi:hypothetical protein
MKLFVLFLMTVISCQSYSAQTAKVRMVKGKVTKLLPGSVKAVRVKKGDILPEDTSIVTSAKSFVKVVFEDKSSMNVGPKSKIIISKLPKKKANMVNLLTGIIKAEVNKNSKKKTETKMLVKTRTAVMGVRGTKFQSTYNPMNKATSLVTVEGNVAMIKVEEESKQVKKIEAKSENISDTLAEKPKQNLDDVDQVDSLFKESKNVVEVPAGRYSGVGETINQPTVPVKIAPKQYNAIAKSMGSNKKAKDVMKVTKSDPAPEGFENKLTGEVAPKAGGIIDFSTGIYVAPAATAELDKKTGTFESKQIGKVNKITGDYIPPSGIKIDAKKGFVIDEKKSVKIASAADKEKLKKTLASLNNDIKKQIVVNKVENKPSISQTSKWLPKNHIISFTLRPYSEVQTVTNKSSKSEAEFYTEKASLVTLNWMQEWNEKWSTRVRIGSYDYEIDKSNVQILEFPDSGNDDDNMYFSLGLGYKYSEKMTFLFDIVEKSEFYVVPRSDGDKSGVEVVSESLKTIDLGVQYFIRDWREFKISATGTLHLVGSESVPSVNGEEDADDMSGFSASGDAYYSWKKNMGINSSLWFTRMSAEADSIEFKRTAFGMSFDFVWDV